jgi:hypothetical protein
MKEEYNKDMESLREKNQSEILEIKSPLNQLKITVEATPADQNNGRENFRALRQNRYI